MASCGVGQPTPAEVGSATECGRGDSNPQPPVLGTGALANSSYTPQVFGTREVYEPVAESGNPATVLPTCGPGDNSRSSLLIPTASGSQLSNWRGTKPPPNQNDDPYGARRNRSQSSSKHPTFPGQRRIVADLGRSILDTAKAGRRDLDLVCHRGQATNQLPLPGHLGLASQTTIEMTAQWLRQQAPSGFGRVNEQPYQ